MRTIIIGYILVALISDKAISQPNPKKRDRVVTVKNSLTEEENFNKVGRAMVDLGFSISKKDKEFGTIISGEFLARDPIGTTHMQVINVTTRDSAVIISSTSYPNSRPSGLSVQNGNPQIRDVICLGKAYNGSYGLFGNLIKLAESVGGEISYSK